MKYQIKYADKIGARYFIMIGDGEIENEIASIKNMRTGEETEMSLDEITNLRRDQLINM